MFAPALSCLPANKKGYYTNPIYQCWTMEKWQAQGQPNARQLLLEKTRSLIQNLTAPDNYEELIREGEEHIKSL